MPGSSLASLRRRPFVAGAGSAACEARRRRQAEFGEHPSVDLVGVDARPASCRVSRAQQCLGISATLAGVGQPFPGLCEDRRRGQASARAKQRLGLAREQLVAIDREPIGFFFSPTNVGARVDRCRAVATCRTRHRCCRRSGSHTCRRSGAFTAHDLGDASRDRSSKSAPARRAEPIVHVVARQKAPVSCRGPCAAHRLSGARAAPQSQPADAKLWVKPDQVVDPQASHPDPGPARASGGRSAHARVRRSRVRRRGPARDGGASAPGRRRPGECPGCSPDRTTTVSKTSIGRRRPRGLTCRWIGNTGGAAEPRAAATSIASAS